MKFKKNILRVVMLGIIISGFAACGSDDDEKLESSPVIGTWKITEVTAKVITNNDKASEAIQKSIEGFTYLGMLRVADLTFKDNENLEVVFDISQGEDPDWEPTHLNGKYSYNNNALSINKISSIDLGGLEALLGTLPPGIIPGFAPEMITKLPELANGFLPFGMGISNLIQNKSFTGLVPLTDMYKDPAKIATILQEQKITDVDASSVTVSKVEVFVKCEAKK